MRDARSDIIIPKKMPTTPIGPVGVIDPFTIISADAARPAHYLNAVMSWSAKYRPSQLVTNLRQGFPTWMAYQAVFRGWPLRVVVGPNQISHEGSDRQWLLMELWAAADDRFVADSVEERDTIIEEMAPIMTMADVMGMRVPNTDRPVVPSGEAGGV